MNVRRRLFVVISLAVLAILFGTFLVYPMIYALVGSLWDGSFTLTYFRETLADVKNRQYIANSLALGAVVTLMTTVVALPLAFITIRRDFPLKRWFSGLVMLPLILPPFVGAIGFTQIFARYGSVNLLLGKVWWGITWTLSQVGVLAGPLQMAPIDWLAGGFWACAIIETLHLYPIMYLNVAASLASVDRSCEEAAYNVGGSPWNVFRRITFPLMLPGYFAGASIVYIFAFTDLGTPLVLAYKELVPPQIFDAVKTINSDPKGYALVMLVLTITVAVFLLARLVVGSRLRIISVKGTVTPSVKRASRKGAFFILLFILGLTFLAVLPHIGVILTSVATPRGWYGSVLPQEVTLEHYRDVFVHKNAITGLSNSLVYSSLATVGAVIIGILIAYLLTRTGFRGAGMLDATVMIPLALPGIILAYGYMGCFSGSSFWSFIDPRVNPVPLLVISYVVRRIPYMVRSAVAGFQHVSISLEEASTNLGAGSLTTLRRVTIPLVLASLLAGAVLTFVFSMFEVSQSLILAQDEQFYPISRVIYLLFGRMTDGTYIASAMGVLGMVILAAGLMLASKFLGRRMGEIFRAS